MKLSQKLFFGFFLFFLAGFSSCAFQDVELVRLENASVKKISSEGIEAEVMVRIKNPNDFNVSIVDTDLDVFLNNKPVGKASIAGKVTFLKRSEEVHRILVYSRFDPAAGSLLGTLTSVLFSQSINLGIKGDITGRAMFVRKKVKVDLNENISLSSN